VIKALSEQRRGAPEAALLYEETAESRARREAAVAQRRAEQAGMDVQSSRPTKQDRRQIHRMKRDLLDS
jgi:ribosome-associated heat shock protein Hsp15